MLNVFRNCYAILLLTCATLAAAEETSARMYQLPGHGSFQVNVPKSWREDVLQPPNNLPPTITFRQTSGPAFQIMVTPIFPAHPGMPIPSKQSLRHGVAQTMAEAAPQAVEKNIALKELRGPAASGYYFSATDKAPAPGEFRLMAQAELGVGELVTVMTVLTDDGSGTVLSQALAMIKSAKHLKQ